MVKNIHTVKDKHEHVYKSGYVIEKIRHSEAHDNFKPRSPRKFKLRYCTTCEHKICVDFE